MEFWGVGKMFWQWRAAFVVLPLIFELTENGSSSGYRINRPRGDGAEPGPEYERSRVYRGGLQSHGFEGRRIPREGSQGDEGDRGAFDRGDVQEVEASATGDDAGEGGRAGG